MSRDDDHVWEVTVCVKHKYRNMSMTLGLSVSEKMKDFIRLGRNKTVVMYIGAGMNRLPGLSGSFVCVCTCLCHQSKARQMEVLKADKTATCTCVHVH